MACRHVAPGPDRIPGWIWREAMDVMAPRVRRLYTKCLKEGVYPRAWRTAKLVLLLKEGQPATTPSFRPICLLENVGMLLERVVAARLERHMSGLVPGWHDSQYGFRKRRSTIDAVRRVRALTEDMVSRGGVALTVSLDIIKASNTMPWSKILAALERFEVPSYLVRLIRAYLDDRWVCYAGREGEKRRPVERGVPQGSVLGPTLWIIAYDEVLRCALPTDAVMVCYADDTLVLLEVGSRMRYLGLVIDSQWMFEPHFDSLIPGVTAAANALCGLLPNIGGAGVTVRRLYEGVVRSRMMYGAPVWADDLMASRRSILLLRRLPSESSEGTERYLTRRRPPWPRLPRGSFGRWC